MTEAEAGGTGVLRKTSSTSQPPGEAGGLVTPNGVAPRAAAHLPASFMEEDARRAILLRTNRTYL